MTNQYGRIEHLHFIRAPAPQSFTWRHWLLHLLRESADLGSMPEVAVWTTGTSHNARFNLTQCGLFVARSVRFVMFRFYSKMIVLLL